VNSAEFASCGTPPSILTDIDLDNLAPAGLQPGMGAWEQRLARDRILATMRQPAIVLNEQFRVQTANRSFLDTFHLSVEETFHQRLFEVGNGQWNFPEVHTLLRFMRRGAGGRLPDGTLEHDFERVGHKAFRINCCRLSEEPDHLTLLALHELGLDPKYRRLFETATDGVLIIDGESAKITDANQFITDLLGCTREQLIGRYSWEIEPLIGTPLAREGFDRVLVEGVVRFPIVRFQTWHSRSIEAEVTGNIVRDGNDQSVQFNLRDITRRRQRELHSENAARQECLAVLAGGIAHDFNNLLAVIIGYATLALNNGPDEGAYRGALNSVISAGQRATVLTGQMLEYCGKGCFVLRRIDFSEIVREAGLSVKSSIPTTVKLEFDLAADPLFIEADAGQMKHLITNLVTNGAEAVPEGETGHIRITTRQEHVDEEYISLNMPDSEMLPGAFAVLEIADSGSGMDTETQARIFDPFFTTRFTGRGLGLAAALGIVKRHRGWILVKSRPGAGTIFRVFLPSSPSRNETDQLPRGPKD
jgi:PAS domain S-box-containing protein